MAGHGAALPQCHGHGRLPGCAGMGDGDRVLRDHLQPDRGHDVRRPGSEDPLCLIAGRGAPGHPAGRARRRWTGPRRDRVEVSARLGAPGPLHPAAGVASVQAPQAGHGQRRRPAAPGADGDLRQGSSRPYGFKEIDLLNRYKGPSPKHWFGTDELGRDEFTRVIYGGRISLVGRVLRGHLRRGSSAPSSAAWPGYYGGWLDNTADARDRPVPVDPVPGDPDHRLAGCPIFRGVTGIVMLLSVFFWQGDARIVRGVFLSLKEKEFVEAARASGARERRIIFYHILPNVTGPIVVNLTLPGGGGHPDRVGAVVPRASASSRRRRRGGTSWRAPRASVFTAPWLICSRGCSSSSRCCA